MHYKLILFFFILFSLIVQPTSYALDPSLSFKQMETDNFTIIYDASHSDLAKAYLKEAEVSHAILKPLFKTSPSKTVIVLDSSTDLANGAATSVPRPTVYVFATLPTELSSIDYFSNWPRDVFLHEYTHILNLEPATGVFKPLRYIFGTIVRPNMFLPRWYLEGLAVEMESRFNPTGRLRSTQYDALIRSFFIENKWGEENLSQINEVSNPFWPEGQRPYFYGALLWNEMFERKKDDPDFISRFNDRYGGRFPFFINTPAEDEFGMNFQSLLFEVYQKYDALAKKQIQQIKEKEVLPRTTLEFDDSQNDHSMDLSSDKKKIAFISQNINGDHRLVIRDISKWSIGDKNKTITLKFQNDRKDQEIEHKAFEHQKISWFPDGKKLAFDAADISRRYYLTYEIYIWDLEKKKIKKLTQHQRAREPDVAPSGKKIAYIKNDNGFNSLYEMTSEGKNHKKLLSSANRISRPEYWSEKEILFALKDETGQDHIHIFNTETLSKRKLFPSLKNSRSPKKVSDGLTFVSSDSGVENLFFSNNDFTKIKPLTNSQTKIINGIIEENKVIVSELTAEGPRLRLYRPSQLKSTPIIEQSQARTYDSAPNPRVSVEYKEEAYWALPYMFPRFWIPSVFFPADGVVTSISTSVSDPTGLHSYAINGSYDSRPEKFNGYFQYDWRHGFGLSSLAVFDQHTYYDSLDETTNTEGGIFRNSSFIPFLSNKWQMFFGYEYTKRSIFVDVDDSILRQNHYFRGPQVGFIFSNMDQGKLEISPSGVSFGSDYTYYQPNSTDTDHDKIQAFVNYYHKHWLPKYHVFALSLRGSYSERNRNIFLATTTTESDFTFGPLLDGFVIRGYPSGQFIGYSLYSGTAEYRFPISNNYSGPNSPFPFFLKRVHGNIFFDTVTLKGAYFDEDLDVLRRAETGRYFSSAGGELKLDSTLFYHAPVTFKITAYYAFDDKAGTGGGYYFSINTPEAF